MQKDQKNMLLENSLERAAERLGDITGPVMNRYYANHPEARASFDEHGLGNVSKLEAEMVESALYCLMNWFDRPEEIRIMFGSTVPHHEDTLKVSSDWFSGLVDALIAVIRDTVPATQTSEFLILQEIHQGLGRLIEEARISSCS